MKRHRMSISVPTDVRAYLRSLPNGSELITLLIRERARREYGARYEKEQSPLTFPEWLAEHLADIRRKGR